MCTRMNPRYSLIGKPKDCGRVCWGCSFIAACCAEIGTCYFKLNRAGGRACHGIPMNRWQESDRKPGSKRLGSKATHHTCKQEASAWLRNCPGARLEIKVADEKPIDLTAAPVRKECRAGKIKGRWFATGQYSSGSSSISVSVGVNTIRGTEVENSRDTGISHGIAVGYEQKIGPVEFSAQVSIQNSFTSSVAKSVQETIERAEVKSETVTVGPGSVWQYKFKYPDTCGRLRELKIPIAAATPNNKSPPCCMPGFFKDPSVPHGACQPGSPCLCMDKSVCKHGVATPSPTRKPSLALKFGCSGAGLFKTSCKFINGGFQNLQERWVKNRFQKACGRGAKLHRYDSGNVEECEGNGEDVMIRACCRGAVTKQPAPKPTRTPIRAPRPSPKPPRPRPPSGPCRPFCSRNRSQWGTKCKWRNCKGCGQCSAGQ